MHDVRITQRHHDQPRRLSDEELIRRLEAKPYSRACREAAQRLRELTRSDKMTNEEALCGQCGTEPAEKPHACPYKEAMGGPLPGDIDYQLCNCCRECRADCADRS